MENTRFLISVLLLLTVTTQHALGFLPSSTHPLEQGFKTVRASAKSLVQVLQEVHVPTSSSSFVLHMGFFDGISKAFSNQEYKATDQRIRVSHILIKGDDVSQVLGTIKQLMGELKDQIQQQEEQGDGMLMQPIFAELARRESQCPSAAQGGDLGLFGPGKMVKEFDEVLFPEEGEGVIPPPVGAILGPVVTDFGCHMILVTQREMNRDQVEEKLARND